MVVSDPSPALAGTLSAWLLTLISSQIKIASLFTDYRIQSNTNNEITISLLAESLIAALRSASTSTSGSGSSKTVANSDAQVIMKCRHLRIPHPTALAYPTLCRLAKNYEGFSVLSFEISSTNSMGRTMNVVQLLLIDVLRHGELSNLKEPMCPEPDVCSLASDIPRLLIVCIRSGPHPPPSFGETPHSCRSPEASRDGRYLLSRESVGRASTCS